MANLLQNMLYRFHYGIVDHASGQRYSVWGLLESVRAVRDVSIGTTVRELTRRDSIPTRGDSGGRTNGREGTNGGYDWG